MKKQAAATDTLRITNVRISSLNPAVYNPRKHTAKQLTDLCESIRRYGLVDPIIANSAPWRDNIVIGGHFRLEAAKKIWMESVPVVFLNIPEIAKEKELNLRLNQNTGEWDYEILKDWDMNLLLGVGFDNSELSTIWDAMIQTEDDDFNIEKKLDEIKVAKSQVGDIYALWDHRLMCGDSTNDWDVARLVQSLESATGNIPMLYCDPPYNIGLSYTKGIGGKKNYGGVKTDDAKTSAEYHSFLKTVLENGLKHCTPDTHVYSWCDENAIWEVQSTFWELGLDTKRVCLWIKNNMNATPQVAFNKVYEPCVYGTRWKPYLSPWEKNLHEVMNREVRSGNQALEDILDLINIWMVKRLPTAQYEHPTAKPPTLHEKALKRCTKAGDIVMDLFGGSGSTLIACHQIKRRAFLMEHEPVFVDLIISRYEQLTGNKAEKISAREQESSETLS